MTAKDNLFSHCMPRRKASQATLCHELAKQLSYYLYLYSFSFGLTTQGGSVGKCHITSVTYHMLGNHR